VYFVADAYPDIPVLQRALMSALDIPAPLSVHRQCWVADDLIQRSLAERATRLVIIDEAQHLRNLKVRDQARTWDWVKWISTADRVSVACTGIAGFESMLREEGQLETRFTIAHLPRWSVGEMFSQFLTAFERSLPVRFASKLGLDGDAGGAVEGIRTQGTSPGHHAWHQTDHRICGDRGH
jgi:hypothetical protein